MFDICVSIWLRAQGVSRSLAIVIAYLIHNSAMSYDAALASVKRRHACASRTPASPARSSSESMHSAVLRCSAASPRELWRCLYARSASSETSYFAHRTDFVSCIGLTISHTPAFLNRVHRYRGFHKPLNFLRIWATFGR
ncbi:hypothetical protein FB451DRAFT_1174396 [Mycena latifolia]|nr:hypothetical protein FB451DRAFT_1174396 [Mycena latifolia]